MASKLLTPEQAAKQKKALKNFHENPDKATSAGAVKTPRALGNVRRKLSDLTDPAAELVKQAVIGGLVPEREVWKGTEEQRQELLQYDPSASFETLVLPDLREVEVLVRYVPVPTKRVEIAKWVITQEASLLKAEQEAKLRKLELLKKTEESKDNGLIPKEDPQQVAKEFGGPKSVPNSITEYDPSWDDDEFEYEPDPEE